jgi:hypothetical protein
MITPILQALGISAEDVSRGDIVVKSPIDGREIGRVMSDNAEGRRAQDRRLGHGVSCLARGAGAAARRIDPPVRRRIARA